MQVKDIEPLPGQSGLNKNLKQAAPLKNDKFIEISKEDPKSKKTLCKFFRNGRCKFGSECKFDHPKMRFKFKQFIHFYLYPCNSFLVFSLFFIQITHS